MGIRIPTRRRAIAIFAATVGGLIFDGTSNGSKRTYEWQGIAMGANARIVFSGIGEDQARATIALIVPEIERLELALSLFREDSEISRLNRYRYLQQPSGDLRTALALALNISNATQGLFDPTVQALWETYADWFATRPDADLPPDGLMAAARRKVDWRRITISKAAIRLGENQRITLNGLGQGYVTDRIAELLRQRGFSHVLVDLGEQRALGPQMNGAAWIIARGDVDPIALIDGALATSEGSGCVFGANGKAHHLFDPRSGRSGSIWRRMTVHHRSAAIADALSTALYSATEHEVEQGISSFPGALVLASPERGDEKCWATPAAASAWRLSTNRLI